MRRLRLKPLTRMQSRRQDLGERARAACAPSGPLPLRSERLG